MKKSPFLLLLVFMFLQMAMTSEQKAASIDNKSIEIVLMTLDSLPFLGVFTIEKSQDGTAKKIGTTMPLKSELKQDFWYSAADLAAIEQNDPGYFELISSFQLEYHQLSSDVKTRLNQHTLFLLYQKDENNFRTNANLMTQNSTE